MTQEQMADEARSAKSRILRLFKFLYEVNRLRYRPERTLQDQMSVIPLTRLPEHPSIQLIRPVETEGQPPVEFELKVTRARITRCPAPPTVVRNWLLSGWDDPTNDAAYADSQNEVN